MQHRLTPRKSAALAMAALVAGCGAANRTDTVALNERSVASAAGYEKAATCIAHNLFPNNKVRVANDGQTFSFTRKDPSASGFGSATATDSTKIEVSLFNNRGISDVDANVFTALSLGDENDMRMVAVGENCVRESLPGAMNYNLFIPLPAPEGYRSLQVLLNPTLRPRG